MAKDRLKISLPLCLVTTLPTRAVYVFADLSKMPRWTWWEMSAARGIGFSMPSINRYRQPYARRNGHTETQNVKSTTRVGYTNEGT
jgi:hypothetical protein